MAIRDTERNPAAAVLSAPVVRHGIKASASTLTDLNL